MWQFPASFERFRRFRLQPGASAADMSAASGSGRHRRKRTKTKSGASKREQADSHGDGKQLNGRFQGLERRLVRGTLVLTLFFFFSSLFPKGEKGQTKRPRDSGRADRPAAPLNTSTDLIGKGTTPSPRGNLSRVLSMSSMNGSAAYGSNMAFQGATIVLHGRHCISLSS